MADWRCRSASRVLKRVEDALGLIATPLLLRRGRIIAPHGCSVFIRPIAPPPPRHSLAQTFPVTLRGTRHGNASWTSHTTSAAFPPSFLALPATAPGDRYGHRSLPLSLFSPPPARYASSALTHPAPGVHSQHPRASLSAIPLGTMAPLVLYSLVLFASNVILSHGAFNLASRCGPRRCFISFFSSPRQPISTVPASLGYDK